MNIHSYFRDIFSSWQTGQIGGCAIIFGLVLLLSGCSSQSTKKEDDASDSSDNDFSGGVVSKKSPKGSNQKKTSGEPNIKSIAKVSKRLEIRPPVKDEFKEFVGINRIALSADGNRAIIRFNGDPNKIQIWDLQSQSKIQEFEDSGEALPVALSPQGDKAAIATALKGVVVKDSMTGAQLHQFIFNKDLRLGFMTDFRFTAEGSMLIGSTTAGFLIGWNVNSGTQTFAKQAASEATKVTTLSPLVEQGNKVAYGTDSGFFHLWDLQAN